MTAFVEVDAVEHIRRLVRARGDDSLRKSSIIRREMTKKPATPMEVGSDKRAIQTPPMNGASAGRIVFSMICAMIVGCGVAAQPASIKTVAAFEVPLQSKADREEFIAVLRAAAQGEGMHVDAESDTDLGSEATVSPTFKRTIKAAVWRGSNDEESVASAMDQYDHLCQVWLMFSKGKDPATATRFRERAMHDIMLHWPGTLSLPIMPTGAIPLHRDLFQKVLMTH